MKKYVLKDNLTNIDQIILNIALNEILLSIVDKRDYLLSSGILVEVEV